MTEEEDVRRYCLQRPLERPEIKWFSVMRQVVAYIIAAAITFYLLRYVAKYLKWDMMESPTSIIWILILILLANGHKVGIFLVRLYQHYASEELRRRCVCKPTCSEYALMAFEKYCWPYAMYKILYRLRYGCQGQYHIDYP